MKHLINSLFLIIATSSILLFFNESPYFYALIFTIGIVFFLILSIGVIWLRANYFLTSKHHVTTPFVLLSFDDGPDPLTTPKILQTLNSHGVKAMFFIVGEKAEKHPEILQQIKDGGHLIGNHTYTHPPLFALSTSRIVLQEIIEGNKIIKRITGEETNWFRPPIGYTNPIIARAVKKTGLTVVGWNKRSFDSVINDSEKLKNRLLKLTQPGSIILLHDNLKQTAQMLDNYIQEAKKNGIIFADASCINSLLK
jgi:peptidoglycan/xylan/chitin deacetylase (PgdA/CDA1 family)